MALAIGIVACVLALGTTAGLVLVVWRLSKMVEGPKTAHDALARVCGAMAASLRSMSHDVTAQSVARPYAIIERDEEGRANLLRELERGEMPQQPSAREPYVRVEPPLDSPQDDGVRPEDIIVIGERGGRP